MKRQIITTADGSKTIYLKDWNEHYHSKHGAIQESRHVFIDKGLRYFIETTAKPQINILEIGFGTGLNAFLTCIEAEKLNVKVNYVGIEAYPVLANEADQLGYAEAIDHKQSNLFKKLHKSQWETPERIDNHFVLTKRQQLFSEITDNNTFDIVYYDAFGARVQPELWQKDMFKIMYEALKPKGVLVTYSAKGSVRRDMEAIGFKVERLPGPPGKRHMLRATK